MILPKHPSRRRRSAGRVRALLLALLMPSALLGLGSCDEPRSHPRGLIVLGMDGLDPKLLRRYADEGRLPNFRHLMDEGKFRPLATVLPPQSPVAWSTFITGTSPGSHGVFDFIHRYPEKVVGQDPAALAGMAYRSSTRTEESGLQIALGSLVIPLTSGDAENLRKGTPYWEFLDEAGVPSTLVRMPANYPPTDTGARCLTGMDTPDLLGTSGTFTLYSDREEPGPTAAKGGEVGDVRTRGDGALDVLVGSRWERIPPGMALRLAVRVGDVVEAGAPLIDPVRGVDGGRFVRAVVEDDRVDLRLIGPPHPMRRGVGGAPHPKLEVPFTVWLDRESRAAKLDVGGEVLVLLEGEWSEWVPVRFDIIPYAMGAGGICRFFLKEAAPGFQLYVSPINIDPADPALPISDPESFAPEIARAIGPFYTQEMAEDTKALTNDALTDQEYLSQVALVREEELRQFDHFLEEFRGGLLFQYFSIVDQNCHVLWRAIDPGHPLYTPELAEAIGDVIPGLYEDMDRVLGKALAKAGPGTAVVVMSDHGFTTYRRSFHLNSWLRREGYVTIEKDTAIGKQVPFFDVDWSRTRAYGLGLNGLYLNRKGREAQGIVEPGAGAEALLDEISAKLLAMKDPETGGSIVRRVFRTTEALPGDALEAAPDLMIGYEDTYRASWDTILGGFPDAIVEDNLDKWSGDHCIDPALVPGVLLSTLPIVAEKPTLADLAPSILAYFGVEAPAGMEGASVWGRAP